MGPGSPAQKKEEEGEKTMKEDKLILGGHEFTSRFILGSGKYNLKLIEAAIAQGGAQIITLALRRANTQDKENILDFIPEGVTLLPNTSGARNAQEAVRLARNIRCISVASLIGEAIARTSEEKSVSSLFD